jgi:hypothetical protein
MSISALKSCLFATGLLLAASTPLLGLDYATSATTISSQKAVLSNLSDSANGTSETDDNRTTIASSNQGTGHVTIQYSVPSTLLASGSHNFWLVVDGTVSGTIEARIWEVNATANRGTAVNVTGSGLSDSLFRLNFSLSSQTTVTTVAIRFSLSNGDSMLLDAVATPEPSTLLLFGIGAAAVFAAGFRIRRRRARP